MRSQKNKKCSVRGCGNTFNPINSFHKVCSIGCAIEFDRLKKKKEERQKKTAWNKEKKQRKEAIMTLGDWKARAQKAVNEYIRLRDSHLSCISCGRDTGCKINAGHYLSVGARPELRFNEDNIHKQCEHCNCFKSGNQAEYRIRLIDKIGIERVEALEGPHDMPQYRIDDIKEIIAQYRAKVKQWRKDNGK